MAYNMKTAKVTICWDCKNATGGCSWSKDFTPVDGWKAKPTKIKAVTRNTKMHNSYIVLSCPQYAKG